MNAKSIIRISIIFACTLLLLWFATSWFEVVANNTLENPTYNSYNFFIRLLTN